MERVLSKPAWKYAIGVTKKLKRFKHIMGFSFAR